MAVKILEKMSSLSTHSNRFVREAAFGIIEIVINTNHVAEHPTTLPSIAKGLTDNWSQVRYRATHAMKAYLTHHKDPSTYPIVLPRLCLNRYYIAEGVRLETQRLWVAVCGTSGVQLVSENLEHFVKYYGEQIKEKNHAVREAACHCVAELVTKVPGVGKYVGVLLNMIDEACDDPSWPVRDIACVSASKILLKYPEECAGMVEGIYKRFLYQAEDPIPSVRQHAGEALANFAKVDKEKEERVTRDVETMLKKIFEQKETSVASTDLMNVTEFGVAKRKHDNDTAAHTNISMFSCGSLAPGPSTARVLGGCCGGGTAVRTGLDPWFATDTAIHTIAFMTDLNIPTLPLLDLIPPTLQVRTFIHYPQYWKTVFTALPTIVRNVGKRAVTEWVTTLVPAMFTCLQCDNQLASVAASDCIKALKKLYGEAVWDSKLDDGQRGLMARHGL
eukprot:TRINITY_DN10005_c0_g1_i2.p1 TRINITY_DN10005_c0_g1~~TRINITY_DN10005_c0_g1_i2.p1  ORF type:complete len:457 (+),score=129.19 TRINITY_DN10005_c0_g1_i2:35-1372(+)